jgi:hypothetical protein
MDNLHTLALSLNATDWAAIASAVAAAVVAVFTIVLAGVGRRQITDTRILQRAYLSVEPKGIEWSTNGFLVGQVAFKNVGKLPATALVSVVKKIEVHDADWVTPILTDAAFPGESRAWSRLALKFFKAAGELLQKKYWKHRSVATNISMCGGELGSRMDLTASATSTSATAIR